MITKKQRPETLFEIRQVLIQAIRANSDLSKLPADAIEDLAKQAARRKFVRRQIIFEAGQPAQDAWILISGKAVLGYTALSGLLLRLAWRDREICSAACRFWTAKVIPLRRSVKRKAKFLRFRLLFLSKCFGSIRKFFSLC